MRPGWLRLWKSVRGLGAGLPAANVNVIECFIWERSSGRAFGDAGCAAGPCKAGSAVPRHHPAPCPPPTRQLAPLQGSLPTDQGAAGGLIEGQRGLGHQGPGLLEGAHLRSWGVRVGGHPWGHKVAQDQPALEHRDTGGGGGSAGVWGEAARARPEAPSPPEHPLSP